MATKKKTSNKAVKKVVAKNAAKPAAKKSTQKSLKVEKAFTKSQIIGHMAECADITKVQASAAFEGLADIIAMHMCKKGPGEFVFPGLAKMKRVRKPATKARKGINPFTGEPTTFAAKPARNVVKIRALKKLKDIAGK